jgi:hypothetical protein
MDMNIPHFDYNRQHLAVYNCDFLEMLRHCGDFIVRKLFRIKKNSNMKTCT